MKQSCDNDAAVRLLYERIRHSPEHGPFIERVESRREVVPPFDATVVVVPGAFHQRHRTTGADGKIILQEAQRLGARTDTIPLPNLGSLRENARIICDWLKRGDEPVILVSLSKGGADVKMALAQPDAGTAFQRVEAWINVSGILDGTPLVGWLFSSAWRSYWTRLLLALRQYDFETIHELDYGPGTPLAFPLCVPEGMRVIHVIGFPQRVHLTHAYARRCEKRIGHWGPNDGAGILLANVLHWPGVIYPVWGTDHYLQPAGRGTADIIRQVLLAVAEEKRMEVGV